MPDELDPVAALTGLREVLDGPLHEIARRLSHLVASRWPHTALIVFTRECAGRPRKVAGDVDMLNKVTIGELEQVKQELDPGTPVCSTFAIAGEQRAVWAVRDPSDMLLVLVPRSPGQPLPQPGLLTALFGIVATSIRQQVAQASPDYLAESRAAALERERTITELATAHESTLVRLLTTLRSTELDDHRARVTATDATSSALVALRTAQQSQQALSTEAAPAAFTVLRNEIRQMLRHHEAPIEFAAPTAAGSTLPGDIAHAARAMTRTAVLALTADPELARLRVAWTCDDATLLVDVRDQSTGNLDGASLRRQLQGRARTLGATVGVDATPGWGSRVTVELPLDASADTGVETRLTNLNRREREVLDLLAQGKRNKAIAADLGVTESTVKFHVTRVLHKLDVSTRGEAAALALTAGADAAART
ncbi:MULTISPECIES: LuxR C-terminal-related transcriptional regulator [Prauserella salsuginis group]|uniref:DNA-binding CsgD family transcriptional regulator n=2 Tax=Prauserella salsuginis group TaxID=2893672 RepID=A0A839XN67_9PSEU|nr:MULTISPECIES: LuxR C-terminal-related transcriptional regulator [Prauserella salsuginis group]MBB3664077.1 DNA-binding CsgD family transcriptional regulator [Prauserella sediminis]MCR3721531.1 regulatory protein, luxR family [Prauserella flava]MCR3734223.1 regulatory protein, luxR family [Prauserella salsuginis]